jgi:hypothetical protein
MIALVPTPAQAAGLGNTIDEPGHPPITTPAAVLMIAAAYLLFFGRGILNAPRNQPHRAGPPRTGPQRLPPVSRTP